MIPVCVQEELSEEIPVKVSPLPVTVQEVALSTFHLSLVVAPVFTSEGTALSMPLEPSELVPAEGGGGAVQRLLSVAQK